MSDPLTHDIAGTANSTSKNLVSHKRSGFKGTIMFYCFDNNFTKHLFNAIFFCGVIPSLMVLIWSVTLIFGSARRFI